MKKTLLLLTLCLPFIHASAQEINKELLYAKWDQYSLRSDGKTIYRDSLAQYIDSAIMARKGNDSTVVLGPDDSLKVVKEASDKFDDIFKSYFIFEKNGQYTTQICRKGKCDVETGQYVWIAKNKITEKDAEPGSAVLTILILTDTKLVMRIDNKAQKKESDITWTKAK